MNFREIDWIKDTPKRPISLVASGVRASGKTFAIERIHPILEKKLRFAKTILISGTGKIQKGVFPFVGKKDRYEPSEMNEVIATIIDIQKKQSKGKRKPPHVCIILDDVLGTHSGGKRIRYSKELEFLFIAGRHYNISVILLLQALSGAVPPAIRSNADILMAWKTPSRVVRKFLVDNFLTIGESRKEAYRVLDTEIWNEPFKAMVVVQSNIQKSKDLSGFVFTYLAPK